MKLYHRSQHAALPIKQLDRLLFGVVILWRGTHCINLQEVTASAWYTATIDNMLASAGSIMN